MQLSPANFKIKWDKRFADNDMFEIEAADLREFSDDVRDSFFSSAVSNVPEYDPRTFYPKDYLVTFNGPFFRAQAAGYLPAPVPGQVTAAWKPSDKPLSSVLAYREMPVIQAQDWSSDGLLVPSTLYRLNSRVNANGNPLDDVLVVAMSRRSMAGADAYTIGIDPQTREEYLVAVSYELATDTTAPRAAGPGGAVNAYTKDEADKLLAAKGSAQVQAQHTQQLATIAVSSSPVFGFLKAGGAPVGYGSLDEAVADTAAKTSQSFNTATLLLSKSNAADGAGWAYATAGLGRTLQLGEGVVLTLPGSDVGTLTFLDFYIEQAPGTRISKVRLLTSAPDTTPPALLPRLSGYCGKPVEFANGGAALLTGYYASLLGTGTAFVMEPFVADIVAPNVKVVRVSAGTPLSPATTTLLGGLIVGAGLQVDGTGKVSLRIDTNTLGLRADGTLYVPTTSGNISAAATPTNVTAVRDHPRSETFVTWDVMPGATLYQVYRQENGGPWGLIANVPYNYFHDNSGPGQGDQFILYYVVAANSAGESPKSTITQAQ